MLVPAPQPNAYWHMDATRGLVKDVDGRPVYVYLVHVSMQDGVHRLCRSGCAPVLAAAYATTDTTALAVQIFLSRLKAAIQLASGSKPVACTHRLQDCNNSTPCTHVRPPDSHAGCIRALCCTARKEDFCYLHNLRGFCSLFCVL